MGNRHEWLSDVLSTKADSVFDDENSVHHNTQGILSMKVKINLWNLDV